MAVVARIEAAASFNDVEFTRGIERAEKRGLTFGGRMETTFQNLFKRTPGRRAERAVTGLLEGITTGDPSSAIMTLAGRMGGLGLAAAAGIGVAIEGFKILSEHIGHTHKLQEELHKSLREPAYLTVETGGAEAAISKFTERQEELMKQAGSKTQKFLNLASLTGQMSGLFPSFDTATPLTKSIQENKARIQELLHDSAQEDLQRAQSETSGNSDQRELAPIYFKFKTQKALVEKRVAGLKEAGISDPAAETELKAIGLREKFITDQVVSRHEARDLEFASAKKLIDLERQGLPEDKKNSIQAMFRIKDITEELKNPDLDIGVKQKLELEKSQQGNLLRKTEKQNDNPFAWGTIAHRDFENESGFGSLAQRNKDMNDPSVFGSLGYNAMQRGELPQAKQESSEVVRALNELLTLTRQAWATP